MVGLKILIYGELKWAVPNYYSMPMEIGMKIIRLQ